VPRVVLKKLVSAALSPRLNDEMKSESTRVAHSVRYVAASSVLRLAVGARAKLSVGGGGVGVAEHATTKMATRKMRPTSQLQASAREVPR
jgi:hypothetical protein